MMHKRIRSLARGAGATLAMAGTVVATAVGAAAGVSGPAFYVDHELYRTVATPTDLSGTGAPAHSFDTIYNFFGVQPSVATAAPGDPGYNGGRWAVHKVSLTGSYAAALAAGDLDGNGVLDATDEIHAAMSGGALTDDGIVRWFVCTVNPVPAGRS